MFYGKLMKIILQLSSNSPLICSSVTLQVKRRTVQETIGLRKIIVVRLGLELSFLLNIPKMPFYPLMGVQVAKSGNKM